MHSTHSRHVLALLPAFAAGIIACSDDHAPTQPGDSTLTFATVSAGGGHVCAVTTPGAAYCWGANVAGQLGDGATGERVTAVLVAGGLIFATVSAGPEHTCGVTAGSAAYCWGANDAGALGDGTTTNRSSPVPVSGGLTFATVSAGGVSGARHTCGVTTGGAADCWGANAAGELGDGTTTNRSSPVPVSGGLIFATVSAGPEYTCGVTTGGATYCWGANDVGELGDGTTTNRSSPVPVSGGLTFATVSTGGVGRRNHTCGVTTGGAAYCWGANEFSQLGDGTTTDRSSPVPVSGGLTLAAVSTGAIHTCAVTTGGAAYCWGANDAGELGDGTRMNRMTPVAVLDAPTFTTVSAGGSHTCGVAADGRVYCWGSNQWGQLGTRPTTGPQQCFAGIGCSTTPLRVRVVP